MDSKNRLGSADTITPEQAAAHRADYDLIQELMRENPEAMIQFVDRMGCVPRILAAKNARLGRPLGDHEIQDAVQDCLVIVWRKLPEFEGRSTLETWIYRICTFELMNVVRRKQRQKLQIESQEALVEDLPARSEPSDDFGDLYSAIDTLDDAERRVVQLKHFDDLTFTEIGDALTISENTAKTRYYRGLRRLQLQLRDRAPELR